MTTKIVVTTAAPLQPPRIRYFDPGASLAELAAAAFEDGRLDRAWDETLTIHVGDTQWPRELWPVVRPKEGAIIALRGHARDVVSIITSIAISVAISTVVAAFTPKPKPLTQEDPLFSLDSARNDVALYQSWPVVLGKHRVFPPYASKPFTRSEGDKVYLYVLLALGLGPIGLYPETIKIGDTPLTDFAGSQAEWKLNTEQPWPALFPPRSPDEEDGPGPIAQADGWVARTTTSDECDRIEADLNWPQGQVRIKSNGETDSVSLNYAVRYRAVGSPTWLAMETGAPNDNGSTYTQTLRTRKPFRKTHGRDVARGEYEIAVRRVDQDYDNPNIVTQFEWVKYRSFTFTAPVLDNNLALLAVKVEAGPHVNGVIDQINVVIHSVAPLWNPSLESWVDPFLTQNPAALARGVAMGAGLALPYGADEIDQAAFGAWYERCAEMDWRCDHDIRAGANMGLDEVLRLIARCGRATLGVHEGKLTPILDDASPSASQLFTPRNSWGLRARRNYPPNAHAYRIEFNNEDKNYIRDEMIVPFPGYTEETAELIPTLQAAGKTRAVEVYRDGRRAVAESILRGMDYSWRTDWENLAAARGRRIRFNHWEVAVGRKSARVRALALNGAQTHVVALDLDEEIEQTLGEDYALEWRTVADDAGFGAPGFVVDSLGITTVAGSSRRVELAAAGGVPIASAPKVGDLVTFGDAGIQTLDLVITDVQRAANFEGEVEAVAYTDALYEDDDAPEPVWQSNVSGDAFPAPPTPIITGVSVTPSGIYVQFELPIAEAARVRAIEGYWRDIADDDTRFDLVWASGPEIRVAVFPPGELGRTYEIVVVAISERGRRAQSAASFVTTASLPDANALGFTPIPTPGIVISGASFLKQTAFSPKPPLLWDEETPMLWPGGAGVYWPTTTQIPLLWEDGAPLLWEDDAPLLWEFPGWDERVHSAQFYTGGAAALATVVDVDDGVAIGLASNPARRAHYDNIDYAWLLRPDGTYVATRFGEVIWDDDGDPPTREENDVFSVVYDNTAVRFLVSGVLWLEVAAEPEQTFFFSSSFYTAGARLDGVSFSSAIRASNYVKTLWRRSIGPPATPTVAAPEDWFEIIPPGTAALWSTQATLTQSDVLVTPWSVPLLRSFNNPRGPYNPTTIYYFSDLVQYNGGSYTALVDSVQGLAPSGTAQPNDWWAVHTAPGAVGDPATPPTGEFTATIAVPSTTGMANLYLLALAAGWDGRKDCTIVFNVASDVVLQGLPGAPDGGAALTTGVWPSGPSKTITLNVYGKIIAGGGKGGDGSGSGSGEPGGKGGAAIDCWLDCEVNIDAGAEVRGGGGGGPGGHFKSTTLRVFGAPVAIPASGGGGGGGQPNGPKGRGGTVGLAGEDGGDGTAGAPGLGGGADGFAGDGGAGGVLGAPGASQSLAAQPGAGGMLVRKNGFNVTVNNSSALTSGAIG